MKLLTFILMYFYASNTRGDAIRNYLADRINFVHDEFVRFQRDAEEIKEQQKLDFGDAREVSIPNRSDAHTFTLFGRNYLLTENELFYIIPDGHKFVLNPLRKFPEMSDKKIEFTKTINYHGIGYMFICFADDSASHVYRFLNNTLEPRVPIQRIKKINMLTDASFFVNENRLHLIVTSSMGVAMAPVVIYKWMESHFDDVEKAYLNGAVAVSHFTSDENSEIIVIRRDNKMESSNSLVYEYKEGKLRKIQILDDIRSVHMLTFQRRGLNYLIVFNDETISTLYHWVGSEFIMHHQFDAAPHVQQVFLAHYNKEMPLIAAATKDKIMIFTSYAESIKFLNAKNFQNRFQTIINMQIADYDGEKVIFILAISPESQLTFVIIPMALNRMDIVSSTRSEDELKLCLDELEELLDNLESDIDVDNTVASSYEYNQKKILPEAHQGAATVGAKTSAAFRQSQFEEVPVEDFQDDYNRIERDLFILETEVDDLTPQLDALLKDNIIVFNGEVRINGALAAEKLTAKKLKTRTLNGLPWSPNEWLTISSDQVITKPFFVDQIKIDHLNAPNSDIFTDMLTTRALSSGNQTLFGVTSVGGLKAFNIFAPQINDVHIRSVYLRSQNAPIAGNKSFNNVNVDDLQAQTLNDRNASETIKLFADSKTHKYAFEPVVNVKNLEVETINGLSWDEFMDNLFRVGKNQTITGDLTFSHLKSNFLQGESIKNIKISDLLTTSTAQNVSSHIHMTRANVQNLLASKINGIDFKEEVAIVGDELTEIQGPVTIKNLKITGNLYVNGSLDEFYKHNHIIMEDQQDLLQMYKRVKINGNVHFTGDVNMPSESKIFIQGNEFNQEQFGDYWLKTANQEIPVHFEAHNGISIPHLNTQLLNDIPIENYMVNGEEKANTFSKFVFENVTIVGNVILDKKKLHQPDLQELDANAVKVNGTYVVHGLKNFDGSVIVENLKADAFNDIEMSEVLASNTNQNMDNKRIKNLLVTNANVKKLEVLEMNEIPLKDLQLQTVFINEPNTLENINFQTATVNNAYISEINNKTLSDYLDELNQLNEIKYLNNFNVIGNASILSTFGIETINDINIPTIIREVSSNDKSIKSNLYFDGKVYVKELLVHQVNDVDFMELVNRLYFRYWPQNITARHTFRIINAPNVFSPQINNIRIDNLIDITSQSPQLLKSKNLIHLKDINFKKSLYANFTSCDIIGATGFINNPSQRVWNSINVNNVGLPTHDNEISRMLNHAVHANNDNIVINAPAKVNHIHAGTLINKKLINGIDIQEIAKDGLMSNETDQIIKGVKTFSKLNAAELLVEGKTHIRNINNIDIKDLDSAIISKDTVDGLVIRGSKTFYRGLSTDHLNTKTISGVAPEDLVSLADLKTVPKVIFDDLTVLDQLNFGFINKYNFSNFLDDRLLLHSEHDQITTANYFMEALQLAGKSTISAINDIEVDDIVFDERRQDIIAPKQFLQMVHVKSDVSVDILNGFLLSDLYEQSMLLQRAANISGNITLQEPSQVTGNMQVQNINGVPFEQINELLNSENHKFRTEIIHDALEEIDQLRTHNVKAIKQLPHQYLYLEKADDLQIPLEHAYGANIHQKKDSVMMNVLTQRNGSMCGLPEKCECPMQETVKIQPNLSWNIIENKYAQRIFSYEHEGIAVDVITNTKSYNYACSANESQEYTAVNWLSIPGGNESVISRSFPEHITGYISDVKFFTIDGHTYVILSKMFDANHNTTLLDSLVLRIAKDKSQVEHVQKLPTNGAFTLHVFYTAQAINLVIGNVGDELHDVPLTTDIYTFNRQLKVFELLRTVPSSGCTSIASVVLGSDSLIILTQKNNSLQVLRYYQFFKQYYFHKSFLHDTPVYRVSVFYTGGFGLSDAFLVAVTKKGHFYMYSYHYLIGWKLVSDGEIDGLTALLPMHIDKKQYLFAPCAEKTSVVLAIVKQGV